MTGDPMTKIVLLFAVASATVALSLPAGAATPPTKLVGTVGPSFTIGLTKGGKKVTTLKPGAYSITIRDKSDFHNFHLTGPGVNKKTTVSFVGTPAKPWNVTLKAGTYRFVCDPHRTQMKGSFTVK